LTPGLYAITILHEKEARGLYLLIGLTHKRLWLTFTTARFEIDKCLEKEADYSAPGES